MITLNESFGTLASNYINSNISICLGYQIVTLICKLLIFRDNHFHDVCIIIVVRTIFKQYTYINYHTINTPIISFSELVGDVVA